MSDFSNRYGFNFNNNIPFEKIEINVRNDIYTCIKKYFNNEVLKNIIVNFFHKNYYTFIYDKSIFIKEELLKMKFHQIFSFIEFLIKEINDVELVKELNIILKNNNIQYKICNKQVVKLISSHEMKEIDESIDEDIFLNVRENIFKALDIYLNNENYAQGIEYCKIALKNVIIDVFDSMENYNNSNIDNSIKSMIEYFFSIKDDTYETLRFCIVNVSSFVNYIISSFYNN